MKLFPCHPSCVLAVHWVTLAAVTAAPQFPLQVSENRRHLVDQRGTPFLYQADTPWMVYSYFRSFNKAWNKNQPDVYEVSHAEFAKIPVRPFFLGESTYEGEHGAWGSALQARKQASNE